MTSDAVAACADMIFADMVQDYASRTGQSRQQVRDAMIAVGIYDALYDERTGLWAEGPDACIDSFERMIAAGTRSTERTRPMGHHPRFLQKEHR